MIVSLIGFAALLLLAFLRMPLGLALGIVGGVGFSLLASEDPQMAENMPQAAMVDIARPPRRWPRNT